MTEPEHDDLTTLLAALAVEPPVSDAALQRLAAYVSATQGAELPEDYVTFLRTANGADGTFANGAPIVLWTTDALPEVNTYEGEPVLPGCLIIGSDAGDGLYGIDMRIDAPAERYVDLYDGPDWDLVLWRGGSFLELLRHVSSPEPSRSPGIRGSLRAAIGRLRKG
jgi:hypothetical protein